ncbi:NAD(P)/FAD-dependent oxidoreductase [Litoreibacter janthinus]|uniref:Glycerol-3-phosphate dehydrogenase n=1 Tax=Litoreibacter janthinus TaxID=670154 RepID=A0A1I6GV43_9RHOB|nr:NAD(P)/FAD-dependent oxidoreductase [Litoreibacter janthinus]SFR46143.1 glycerol-3-phosphate dehydrogenase [Litoreibacter janthinus]
MPENKRFDVVVIGAGVVGCAMARRFTLEGARVAILERATDILAGASKANSAILHTGFDAPEGSLELECVRAGYQEYQNIRGSLGLVQDNAGAYVVAWKKAGLSKLEALKARAHRNGITDVELVSAETLKAQEPNLSDKALGAAFVPTESLIDPWSAPYVYLHQAIENGAHLMTSCDVTSGVFDGEHWRLDTTMGSVEARVVINCAGLYGDLVDQALLGASDFTIKPRKGQFVVFDKAASKLLSSIILPVPSKTTKGIVLFRTVFGNLAVGPTAEEQRSRTDTTTDEQTLKALIADAVTKVPALKDMPVTATYAGLRPATENNDYQILPKSDRNWITVGGIRSTGLSGALGIAQYVYRLYSEMGRSHEPLANPATPQANQLAEGAARDWTRGTGGEVVCHCELVTKREIETALSGPLRARSIDGLKRQTRATMGRCQGFYCAARLAELTSGHFERPLAEKFDDYEGLRNEQQ